jgi:hypothetical protein
MTDDEKRYVWVVTQETWDWDAGTLRTVLAVFDHEPRPDDLQAIAAEHRTSPDYLGVVERFELRA